MNTADSRNSYQQQYPSIRQPVELPFLCTTSYDRYQCPDGPKQQKQTRRPRFRAPRLAHSPNFPQQQPQIIGRTLERMCFAHIGLTAQPTPPSAAGLADMRKGAFAPFAPPPIQLPPVVPAHPPAVGAERRLVFDRLVGPAPGLLPPLRNIRSHPSFSQFRQPAVVVVTFVHHHFGNCRPAPDSPRPGSAWPVRSADRTCRQRLLSSPQLPHFPRPPQVPPCKPSVCARLSSWRSGCRDRWGFPTVHWRLSCPCARDPTAGGPVVLPLLSSVQALGRKAGHQRPGFGGVEAQLPA